MYVRPNLSGIVYCKNRSNTIRIPTKNVSPICALCRGLLEITHFRSNIQHYFSAKLKKCTILAMLIFKDSYAKNGILILIFENVRPFPQKTLWPVRAAFFGFFLHFPAVHDRMF